MITADKIMQEIHEETTTKNIQSMLEHGNETRKLARKSTEKVIQLEAVIRGQDTAIQELRSQLAAIQSIVFRGGTNGD